MVLHRSVKFGALLVISLGLLACTSTPGKTANLKKIYDQTAQYHAPDRNPIIVIPGILGSRLVDDKTGQTVWGAFRTKFADPNTDEGARLISLSLNTQSETEIEHVRPDGVLENLELNLAGFPIKVQAYAGILATLGAGGYRDETLGLNSINYGTDHFTCFQFDYDWRRDITYNAAALKTFIDEKRIEIQHHYKEQYGIENAEVKFDIAAHSMGSLLTRYFLRYGDAALPEDGSQPVLSWAGAKDVERAILVAPPNAGSLEAFDQLLEGFNTGRPLLPHYPAEILGTFPSVYQMLPRNRHKSVVWDGEELNPVENLYSPALWQKYGWGLSGKDKDADRVIARLLPDIQNKDERYRIASEFQARALKRAQQFHRALDKPALPPAGLNLYLVAGDATEMAEVMTVNSKTGRVDVLRYGIGDKTVLRSSALMDERIGGDWEPTVQSPIDWTAVLFVPAKHRKITRDPVFEDNVLYWLLEDPRTHDVRF